MSLLQTKFQKKVIKPVNGLDDESEENAEPLEETNIGLAKPAVEYFKHWAKGSLDKRMALLAAESSDGLFPDEVELMFAEKPDQKSVSTSRIAQILDDHRVENCPDSRAAEFELSVQDSHHNDGAQHVLLQSQGRLQYLALSAGRVLAAYPSVCPSRARKAVLLEKPDDSELVPEETGEKETLAPKDPLVKDALDLLKRTVAEDCGGKKIEVDVLGHPTIAVTDGMTVKMLVQVNKKHKHSVECDFEMTHDKDAQLLEFTKQDELPEEKEGMTAKVAMKSKLCDIDKASSLTQEEAHVAEMLVEHPMGELSRAKGYEHVNDGLPKLAFDEETTASSYDLRTAYSNCFPGTSGSEVVRNQGTCGSCWAFASASALMANLCISSN